MSYHVYTTDGIILKRTAFGEANVVLHILTRDHGLIIASAQAVRMVNSKLNSALQEYSHTLLSCIKGKNGWKIINSASKENFFFPLSIKKQQIVARVASVLVQMLPGEEIHPAVFEVVCGGYTELVTQDKFLKELEALLIARILYHLGYIGLKENTLEFVSTYGWGGDVLEKVEKNKLLIISHINKAFKESQL